MGKYPREENALVLQDATVLMLSPTEFEQLALQNTRIIMKMLKVFSNQLRRVHKQVENLLKTEEVSPEVGLYNTGEYYLKNRMYSQAVYVLSRYLTYYPTGKYAQEVAKQLEVAEANLAKYGQGKGPQVQVAARPPEPKQGNPANPPMGAPAPAPAASGEQLSDTAKQYYNGVSLFSQEKYQQAFMEFKKIIEANQDMEYVAKSAFEQGRCIFALGQFDGVIAHFSRMIQAYPKHPDLVDALFYIGQAYEKKGDKARAAGFYKKILSMELDEDDGTYLKARRALKMLEVA
jgi:TolA-binding protein